MNNTVATSFKIHNGLTELPPTLVHDLYSRSNANLTIVWYNTIQKLIISHQSEWSDEATDFTFISVHLWFHLVSLELSVDC